MSKETPSMLRLQARNLVDIATHAWRTSTPLQRQAGLIRLGLAATIAVVLTALAACGEKTPPAPPEVDEALVKWFVEHEAEGRAELQRCAVVAKGKPDDWSTSVEGLRCRAANQASYRYKTAPLGTPTQFKGGASK